MIINKKSKIATSAKNIPVKAKRSSVAVQAAAPKTGKAAKNGKALKAAAKAVKLAVKSTGFAIALLTGERGILSRKVETGLRGKTFCIRALQDNAGLSIVGEWAEIHDGKLTAQGASKQARIELGGYVNGRNTGASVETIKESQFTAKAKAGYVRWNADKDAVACQFIGDASKKGIVAVKAGSMYWQAEQDSNPNNRHERATVSTGKPAKASK